MSYAVSAALQAAVFDRLTADAALSQAVSGAIFDAEPHGSIPQLYVVLGSERVRARADNTGGGALHELDISVVTETSGFATAKVVAGQISDLLVDAELALTRGHLVSLRFAKAKAARIGKGTQRRVDLTFRARIDDA